MTRKKFVTAILSLILCGTWTSVVSAECSELVTLANHDRQAFIEGPALDFSICEESQLKIIKSNLEELMEEQAQRIEKARSSKQEHLKKLAEEKQAENHSPDKPDYQYSGNPEPGSMRSGVYENRVEDNFDLHINRHLLSLALAKSTYALVQKASQE